MGVRAAVAERRTVVCRILIHSLLLIIYELDLQVASDYSVR